MNHRRSIVLGAALGTALLFACAEVPPEPLYDGHNGNTGGASTQTTTHSVSVQTRFVLAGLDTLGDDAALESLYVHVGSLLLDPADSSSVALSSREPFALEFDVQQGVTDIRGPELTLPFGGEFFVSVQVVPDDVSAGSKSGSDAASILARGLFRHDTEIGLDTDEPSPLPWEPKALQQDHDLSEQRPFVYRSAATARIQLGEIHLREGGAYELVLTVNVGEWLRDDVLPLVRTRAEEALDDGAVPTHFDDGNVELDEAFEDDGPGAGSLVGDIDLGTRRF